jgi:hypothetical protein
MNNLLSIHDLEEFEFRIVKKTAKDNRIVFVDGKFTEEDLKFKKRSKKNASKTKDKNIDEYAEYKFKYLNGSLGKTRSVPLTKDKLGEKLKTIKYFSSSPPYNDGIMHNYLVPELFTLGLQTCASEKFGVIQLQAGEVWLFVKPPTSDRVIVENSLDPEWFKTWGYCRITPDNSYVTVNPTNQFFFVTVEKSLFLFTYSAGKAGFISVRVPDVEESEDVEDTNETDSSVITTTTISDQCNFTDFVESPVLIPATSQGYENVRYVNPISNNAVKRHATSSISTEPSIKKYIDKQPLEILNQLADYITKRQKEYQQEEPAYLLAQVQQFQTQPQPQSNSLTTFYRDYNPGF